ncbi:Acetyl-coenzyme A synthetase (Acetate--CoA ligase) (Acyl-activating enzyme) [Modestobacter italicus]|uniref:Acetyl-coenzyme A synthetase n=1 Tax=Modestobacter italicus (strain DSM 44449 / CECT 9708 / BC 501) TaxID=2732864 RepID=I4ERQ3_MODI5|nr:acetate--CoA ligase [Modestobacter marinus]CCH86066.1 Acetyl-coenzyme A synthetase (Acetate--CoA ligase) (Acyl-activating enzyme) [Modestobacter marinus]
MSETTEAHGLTNPEGGFPPPEALAAAANVGPDVYDRAAADRVGFWEEAARRLDWAQPWDQALDWSNPPFAKWFVGGKLNVAVNCVDRHVDAGHGDQVAYHWIGEPGDTRTLTYAQLKDEVCKAANALVELGVQAGDRVAIYLPMIPEAVVAMLACARIGAVHMVVFGGFSPDALASRITDADAKVVITADGGYRRGAPSALKPNVDEALTKTEGVRSVLVVRRTETDVEWTEGRDVWWHELVDRQPAEHEAEAFDAEHPLYIMYTSGTTAKPKGILHTTGGYLTQVSYSHWAVFDIKPDTDVFWTAADVGWVTGHSYIVYGPLSNRTTSVMYEGTPETPHRGRWWEIVQEYGVTVLYTAPTTIRTFMKWGEDVPAGFDLSSLRLLGSVGEPINPEAWLWYHTHIGGGRCPIVDTWWQTETGAHMITPLPAVTTLKPGSAQRPLPGIAASVVDEEGKPIEPGATGYLVLTEPWPAMLRTIWGDDDRYVDTYWSRYGQGVYFAGDGAKLDEDGDIWLLGRVDDVMNVSGHRISTTEVESALVSHPTVAEAAVVGATDPTTGQGIVAFVILRGDAVDSGEDLVKTLRQHVRKEIGPIASPRQIMVVAELPKTRSGKIMRRLLRDVAENRELGDVTTLTDSSVMELISSKLPSSASED